LIALTFSTCAFWTGVLASCALLWTSAVRAAMQLAPVPPFNGGVLAGCSLGGLGPTALAGPVGTETRCLTYFIKCLVVN